MLREEVQEKIRRLPRTSGVYLMRDRVGKVIYVGKAKNLHKRVSSYFQPGKIRQLRAIHPKIHTLVSLVYDLDIKQTKNEAEALLLESQLIKQFKPIFNTDQKDDKRFLMVRVDVQNPIPQFKLVRNELNDRARYYGPFVNSSALRNTLKELRLKFGVILSDCKPKRLEDGRYRLYDDMRADIFTAANEVTTEEYFKRVELACSFLEGKARDLVEQLKEKMKEASEAQQYERAARYRDQYLSLNRTLNPTRKTFRPQEKYAETPLKLLQQVLQLKQPPAHMECFDISHISGTFVVASMVCFKNGIPERKLYRRYQIKSFTGNDDYRAMCEVVERRYRSAKDNPSSLPNLVVIDGGKGQVHAAMKAFLWLELPLPPIIGLAKKRETIVFPEDDQEDINLAENHPALHLLQRIRDEAHRYANQFNASLRSKKIQESVLDYCEGLGPVKRQALLDHFKDIKALKAASVEKIQQVEGIGPKLAFQVCEFLSKH